MIIPQLWKNINEYEEILTKKKSGIVLMLYCPYCGGATWRHGGYWRNFWEYSKKRKIWILRVKCKCCGKTHAVIPDFLLPDRKYSSKEIEQVIEAKEEGTPISEIDTEAEESTMRRWWNQFKERSKKVIDKLESKLAVGHQGMLSLIHSDVKGLKRLKLLLSKFLELNPKEYTCKLGLANHLLNAEGSLIYL